MPIVSIIIPCRNYGHFIGEAIESALAQTHDEIELLVVDYGSTDQTEAVVARFPKARLVQSPDKGLSVARNFGLEASKGEFLVFLDADDLLVPDAIASSYACFEDNGSCAFVYGHESHFGESGPLPNLGLSAGKCLTGDPYAQMLRANHPLRAPGAMLYRRDAVERIGGFTPGLDGCADIDLNLRLAREHRIVCNDRVVLMVRVHGINMTQRWGHMLSRAVTAQKKQRRFVQQHPIYQSDYQAGLRVARQHWGSRLEKQIAEEIRSKNLLAAARNVATLTRHDPERFSHLVRRRAKRLISAVWPSNT